MRIFSLLSLVLMVGSVFAADQNPAGQTLQDQRLAAEANSIINPNPMQTVSAQAIDQATDTAKTTSQNTVQNTAPKAVAQPKTQIQNQTKNTPPKGVMAYYQSLIDCKQGVFKFDNPAYAGVSNNHSQSSITTSIEGLQSGYCQVHVYVSGANRVVECLFSASDRQALGDKKAEAAFQDAYVNGNIDTNQPTPYDKMIQKNCQ